MDDMIILLCLICGNIHWKIELFFERQGTRIERGFFFLHEDATIRMIAKDGIQIAYEKGQCQ